MLGGELTTDRVCRECDTKAVQEIDKPLLDDWFVALQRMLWDIRDNHRRQDRQAVGPSALIAIGERDANATTNALRRLLQKARLTALPRSA